MKIAAPLFVVLAAAACPLSADETVEPPLTYTVTIGDKTAQVSDGQTVQIDGEFKDPKITVTPSPFRVFPYGGMSFKYPSNFTFEAALNPPHGTKWVVAGNDVKVIVLRVQAKMAIEAYAQMLMGKFGPNNSRITNPNAKTTFGKHELSGMSLGVKIAGIPLTMDIYRLPAPEGQTRMLIIQDGVNRDGVGHTEEARQMLAALKESFKLDTPE